MPHNTFKTLKNFKIGQQSCQYYSLPALGQALDVDVSRLPVSVRIVLESVLRNCDGKKVTEAHVRQLSHWKPTAKREDEIPFVVARVVLDTLGGRNLRRAAETGDPEIATRIAAYEMADRWGCRYVQVIGDASGPLDRAAEGFAALCDRAADHGLYVEVAVNVEVNLEVAIAIEV